MAELSTALLRLLAFLLPGEPQQPRSVVDAKRAHPLQVECLVDANVDVVSLANGQSMGFQEEGLLDTWEALESAGVAHAGSGDDRQTALRPAILHSLGRRLAYFSISAAGGGLRDASGVELWAARACVDGCSCAGSGGAPRLARRAAAALSWGWGEPLES